jgi:hypothetical protein
MALIKAEVTTPVFATTGAIIEQAVTSQEVAQEFVPVVIEESTVIYAPAAPVVTAVPFVPTPQAQNLPSVNPTQSLQALGFEGLVMDWTSYSTISLKEGTFQDGDGKNYGKDFNCYLRGSKEQYVFRGNPVQDNRRDVVYSFDKITTTNGLLVADKRAEWLAQGKQVDEKLYLQVLVEMVAPGEAHDGDFRMLSVSPTSKGRFSGHAVKCAALGGGDPGNVVSKVLVGAKVTGVAIPFFPWSFEVVKH